MTEGTADVAHAVESPEADTTSGDPSSGPAPAGSSPRWLTGRRVLMAGAGLVALQLLLRGWVAANGFLYWDDFILEGRAARLPLFSADFLLYDHDGHFMPAGFLLTGALTRLAPLEWWPMVVVLVLLQAVASLAAWRLLRTLLGDRPAVLVPLVLVLFSPLTIPSFTWWAAALNALPLQAGLAWVLTDAIRLARTGERRYAITGTIAFAVSLSFFEKSVIVPVVAFATVVLVLRNAGEDRPIVSTLRRAASLWIGMLLVLAVWAWAYAAVVGSPAVDQKEAGTVPQAVELVVRGIFQGLLPSLVGGPLSWDQLYPGTPYATPMPAVVALGLLAAAVVVAWTTRRRRSCGVVWWLVAGYVAASAAAMVLARSGRHTPDVLPQTLRYFADTIVVVAVAIALVIDAPPRPRDSAWEFLTPAGRRATALGGCALFAAASIWSTVDHVRTWAESSTPEWLATARASLAAAADDTLLDHEVPQGILWPLARPDNYASHVFAPQKDRPRFARVAADLRVLDESGHLVDARVTDVRQVIRGPVDGCGHLVEEMATTRLALNGPLIPWGWTAQLNYVASRDGDLTVSLSRGESVRVPVRRGAHAVYLYLTGGGEDLRVTADTPALSVCIDTALVGFVERAPQN